MNFETILLEKKEAVARITLNRPKVLNAFSAQMSAELKEAVTNIAADKDTKVVVITGAGNTFMSGADITMIQDWARVSKQGGNVKEILDDFFSPTMLEELPQPVIAAVNGYALGMGCEIALGCDLRIASENTRFGQPEITLGIMTGGGGSVRLTRLIGKTKAMEMVLTGGLIDAQEAYRLGLVNRVVQIAELDAAIDEMTRKLISKGAIALRSSKASVNRALEVGLKDAIANELNLFSEIFKTEDAREGATAFLEKRKPHFQGK